MVGVSAFTLLGMLSASVAQNAHQLNHTATGDYIMRINLTECTLGGRPLSGKAPRLGGKKFEVPSYAHPI